MQQSQTGPSGYRDPLFAGLPKKVCKKMQLVQKAAAKVLPKIKKMDHMTPLLKTRHWLSVCFRNDFKVILLVFKASTLILQTYLTCKDHPLGSLGTPRINYCKKQPS